MLEYSKYFIIGIAGLVMMTLFGNVPSAEAASCDPNESTFVFTCTIDEDRTIPYGTLASISSDVIVTIAPGVTFINEYSLSNRGTIINHGEFVINLVLANKAQGVIENHGTITNNQSIDNDGIITNVCPGEITGSGEITGTGTLVECVPVKTITSNVIALPTGWFEIKVSAENLENTSGDSRITFPDGYWINGMIPIGNNIENFDEWGYDVNPALSDSRGYGIIEISIRGNEGFCYFDWTPTGFEELGCGFETQQHTTTYDPTPEPDTTAPVVTVPDNIQVDANSADGANVSFSVSALDDVDGIVNVTCSQNSGTIFSVGVTDVSCSAHDSSDNLGSNTFSITVSEYVEPEPEPEPEGEPEPEPEGEPEPEPEPEPAQAETQSSSSSSKDLHKTRPTFGLDHKTGNQIIEGGFEFNENSFDITDSYWTPFPEQEVKVGETNTFTIKTFADKQLHIKEFLFGIPEVGKAHEAELNVEIFFNYDKSLDEIKIVQKTNIVDPLTVEVTNYDSKCSSDSVDKRCITTELSITFLEPLKDKVMAFKATDFKNRYEINYLNDGFDISGESLNPMKTMTIPGPEKYEGIIKVTQKEKYSDIWICDDGREFQIDENGTIREINPEITSKVSTGTPSSRNHSHFAGHLQNEIENAEVLLHERCPNCLGAYVDFEDPWTIPMVKTDRNEVLGETMKSEQQRALKFIPASLNPSSLPDVKKEKDNRTLKVIFAEDREFERLLGEKMALEKQMILNATLLKN